MLCIVLVLLVVSACAPTLPQSIKEAAVTDIPPANIPNPASVNCIDKGNKLEIITAEDGSQSGVCTFPDGSSCEEWAYFRGECLPSTQNNPETTATLEETTPTNEIADDVDEWRGLIKSTSPGAQFDDYFERRDLGQVVNYGIDARDPAVQAQIVALRDTGRTVHLWGTLLTDVPDAYGSQVQVERIEEASGGSTAPETAEAFADWWGVIVSRPAGAQFDDSFERRDLGQVITFGIDSRDPAVQVQIITFRDSNKVVHIFGRLISDIPDYNGVQIQVERIELEE